ncbi:putative glutamate--tRNA ligase, mitochondrial [Armadillidium nasatum]|uniref:Putative glutamate--tRNA ligase, mitochondrial n=1 Tax=Armadillidium nasatum TaxID=96803 RepID=A0A5N5TJV2_9CRUS|nr:putative glutamate--tRNA ligase, mitochondrial [Armadillidium nasatum]
MPYDNKCRNLSLEEIARFEKENVPFCVRLKMKKEVIHLNDLVYGKREFKPVEQEGDFVILKTDGMPTYHFANVVDDHLMKITHVLRGSEWLPSIPKHLQLYRCFDWDPPIFAHLPTILNTDGTKLSKRQKDLHVKHFQQEGYSPEAILNIIKLSGGGFANYEYDKLSTMEELINQFEMERVSTTPGGLDFPLLNDFNRYAQIVNIIFYEQVITWGLERISKLNDFTSSDFHFIWVHPTVTKSDVDSFSFDARMVLVDLRNSLQNIQPQNFMKEAINEAIKEVQMKHNLKTNKMMKLIRLVDGPPIVESFLLAGKDNVIHRLQAASVL